MYPTLNAGTSRASQSFWQVDDVEREVAELKARGVKFEEYDMPGTRNQGGIVTAGGEKTAWFKARKAIFSRWCRTSESMIPEIVTKCSPRRPTSCGGVQARRTSISIETSLSTTMLWILRPFSADANVGAPTMPEPPDISFMDR